MIGDYFMDDNKDLLNEIDKLDDNEENIDEKEKSTSHEKVFTIVIVAIIIVSLFMLYLSYKGTYIVSNKENKQDDFSMYLDNVDINDNNNEVEYEEIDYAELERQKIEKFEQEKINLAITSQVLDIDNKLIATIHNGNQETIESVLVQVIFYDGEDKPIKIDENIIDIFDPETDYYMHFQNTPKGYERCDFLITKKDYYSYYNSRKNDITFNIEEKEGFDGKKEIEVIGKNNSEDKIQIINFAIIFYNENDQIIALREQSQYDVKKQKEFKMKLNSELYSYETFENIPYSRYEIILLDAIAYSEI